MSPSSPTAESSITHVIELTPAGRGAVAVVLVSGPDAVSAVAKRFSPASERPITDSAVGRILFGRWGADGEELVVCRRSQYRVEIHSHGGAAAVRAVVDGLIAEGCRSIPSNDWLQRSSPDAIQAAAQIAIADALTARTAAILLDQLNGALTAAIHSIVAAIGAADWPRAAEAIDELLGRRDLGLHLTTPWRVVFAGAPNVGKSSLINALAGYERAIVSPLPGTTRDVVTVITAIDGWPVQLADTAGLRATHDELESAGVALAEASLASADLAIFVHDITSSVVQGGLCLPNVPSRVILVRNKLDLVDSAERRSAFISSEIATSTRTGEGIAELAAAIGNSLVPWTPADGSAVPFTAEQYETLSVVRNAIWRHHASAANDALQSLLAKTESAQC